MLLSLKPEVLSAAIQSKQTYIPIDICDHVFVILLYHIHLRYNDTIYGINWKKFDACWSVIVLRISKEKKFI